MLPTYVVVNFSVSVVVFWHLRNVCFIVIFIKCFKLLVSQKNSVCVCVCAHMQMCACVHARKCVCVCVCVCVCMCMYIVIVKYFAFVFEEFLALCCMELFIIKCIKCFM